MGAPAGRPEPTLRMRMLLESGRPIQARPLTAGFGVRPRSALGQPLWMTPGGGLPSQAAPAPGGGGAPTLECYQCGNQGYRQMTEAMAAQVPGGCTKVDPSLCSSEPAVAPGAGPSTQTGNQGGFSSQACGPLTPMHCAQPLEINVSVFRADTVQGAGGVHVRIELLEVNQSTGENTGSPQLVHEGETDAGGKLYFDTTVPAPALWHRYRVTISPGSSFSFPSKAQEVQGFQPNNAQKVGVAFAACPAGTNDVICEVGEMQVLFTSIFNQQLEAWGQGQPQNQGSSAFNFAFKMGYFYVHQVSPRNRVLQQYWEALSYGVCDVGIPPTDWPRLLDNYEQVQNIFNAIPWPSSDKARLLFRNCARGLPIYNGKPIAELRLFAPTFSDYFPREDYKIRGDMGSAYLLNIHMIFQCMVEELEREAEALRRSLASLSFIRLICAFIFAPLTGGAMLTTLVAEEGQYVVSHFTNNALVGNVQGVIAGVSKNVGIGAAAIGAGLFAAGAALLIPLLVQGADPTVQKIAEMFGPKVAEAAAKDVLDNVIGNGTVAGEGLMSAAGLGTAGATLAVEAMLSMISLRGVEKAQQFVQDVAQVKDFIGRCATTDAEGKMCAEIVPFVLWCIESMMLDKFFDHVAAQAGISGVDTNAQVIQPAAQEAEKWGVTVPASATTPGAAPSTVAGGLAAVAGVGAGGFLALLLTGALAG